MPLREVRWKFSDCSKGRFEIWFEEFSPEKILLFAGDCAFKMNIAANAAREFHVPITIYANKDLACTDFVMKIGAHLQ